MTVDTNLKEDMNDLMRIRNLRSLSSRLRGRGDQELNDIMNPEMDGASQDPYAQDTPLPPEELIPPQANNSSIDVRANELNLPGQEPEQPGLFSRLGSGIRGMLSGLGSGRLPEQEDEPMTPPQQTPIAPPAENVTQPSQIESAQAMGGQPLQAGFFPSLSGIKDWFNKDTEQKANMPLTPAQMEFYENLPEAQRQSMPGYGKRYEMAKAQGMKTPQMEEDAQFMQKIDEAAQSPGKMVVPGAASMILEDPVLSADFKQVTGIDYEPMIAEELTKYERVIEEAIQGIQADLSTLDESELKIRDRISRGELTTQDKILMGIALFLPMIIAGLVGGKEGAIGALGGSAQGLAQGLAQQGKNLREDEDILRDISKQKTDKRLKQADLGLSLPKLKDNLRNAVPKSNDLFEGMTKVTINTPQGAVEGYQILPGVIAEPSTIYDKESKKDAQKAGRELSHSKQVVTELNEITDNILDVLSKTDLPENVLAQAYQHVLTDKVPAIDSKLGQTIDYKGRKVNSAVILNNQMALLKDAYRMMKKMRAFTNTVQEHTADIMSSPYGSFLTSEDLADQMMSVRELSQSRLLNEAISNGFLVEPIISDLSRQNKPVADRMKNQHEKARYKEVTTKK